MCTNYYYDDGILCYYSNNLADTMKMDILLPTTAIVLIVAVAPSSLERAIKRRVGD